jgi:hypothetical protein
MLTLGVAMASSEVKETVITSPDLASVVVELLLVMVTEDKPGAEVSKVIEVTSPAVAFFPSESVPLNQRV